MRSYQTAQGQPLTSGDPDAVCALLEPQAMFNFHSVLRNTVGPKAQVSLFLHTNYVHTVVLSPVRVTCVLSPVTGPPICSFDTHHAESLPQVSSTETTCTLYSHHHRPAVPQHASEANGLNPWGTHKDPKAKEPAPKFVVRTQPFLPGWHH